MVGKGFSQKGEMKMEPQLAKDRRTSVQASDTDPQPIRNAMSARLQQVRESLGSPSPRDAELAQRESKEEPARRRVIVNRLIDAAGIRFGSFQLSKWIDASPAQRAVKAAVLEWCRTFPERKRSGESLVLYGPCGTGKDHLAFGAVAAAVEIHGCTAGFRNGRELMAEYRDRIGSDKSESGLMDCLTWQDVLILSDPLPVRGELTDFQADVLYRLVDGRSAAGLLTVCTLNVANDGEADRRLGPPTWDRLCDRAWKLACFWDSYRKPAMEILP
jgi:DNA replication protein DnaC